MASGDQPEGSTLDRSWSIVESLDDPEDAAVLALQPVEVGVGRGHDKLLTVVAVWTVGTSEPVASISTYWAGRCRDGAGGVDVSGARAARPSDSEGSDP